MSLDRRIADEQRMKGRAERIARHRASTMVMGAREFLDPRSVGKIYSTHGSECSCPMCGNPRKHFNQKTRQEERFEISDSDE